MQKVKVSHANLTSFAPVRLSCALVALCFCMAMFCRTAAAQTGQQFVGHISDPSGASVAGATVTVHNEATGEEVIAKATGAGDYTVPYLKAGLYTVTATETGFKSVSKTHIELHTDQTSKMDFSLPIGNVTETVTVSSSGSQIELSKADRGEIIDAERVQEMPSDGRNYQTLLKLSPGTNDTSNPQYPRQQDNVSNNLHAQGIPEATVQENLDGGTNDTAAGWSASNVPLDSVAEFKVVLNPYDASYGRAGGGAIDASLKSGTNKYHGDIYEFARRPYMDAQSYSYDYQKSQGTTAQLPSKHKRDIFGLEVDGPVSIPHIYDGKDKTFFTAQWEQAYENLPNNGANIDSIPDPRWTTGNFAGAQYYNNVTQSLMPLIIYDPLIAPVLAPDPLDGNKLKLTRTAFAGNVIPANRLDPVGVAIAQYYNQITPNATSPANVSPFQKNHFYLPVETDISRNGLFKLDQNFGSRDRGTLRWTGFERLDTISPNGLPDNSPINNNFDPQVQPKEQQYAIDEIHTFSPNLILDNKLTAGTEEQGISSGFAGFKMGSLGFAPSYISSLFIQNRFPNVNSKNYIGLSGGGTSGRTAVHNLGYQPSVTYSHGRHTFRTGLDMRLYQLSNVGNANNNKFGFGEPQNNLADSPFTSQFYNSNSAPGISSGNSIADLVLGYPSSGSLKVQNNPFYSQHYYGIWAQDDWKITPKLTLNLGIRYDLLGARTERHNKMNYAFDTTSASPIVSSGGPLFGGIRFAGVNGAPRGAYKTNLLNIQPRFGIAYAFSPRTSLRAGFGEMFIQDEANDSSNGFTPTTNFNLSLNNGQTPSLNNPCVPGSPGCATSATPGSTLANPYSSIVPTSGSTLGLATTPGSSVNFTNPNFQVPSLWQYSVSLEQLLTAHDTLDISYSGNRGYNIEGNYDLNHVSAAYNAMCDIERGGNRHLCQDPANQLPNEFKGNNAFLGTSYYTNSTLSPGYITRPFRQFTSVTEDHLPLIHSWYNSLQVVATHNVSKSLTFHFAYTWAKSMTAGNIIDSVNGVHGRTIDSNDIPNAITLSGVFYVPVGRGKALLGHTNRLVDAAVGGWQISPLYIYENWYPWTPGNNFRQVAPISLHIHDLPADAKHHYKRLQGVSPCVEYEDSDTAGLLHPGPMYTAAGCTAPTLIRIANDGFSVLNNIVYTGVRLPASHQFDVSVSKRFAWSERANLQLRLDAFNVLNHPNWTYHSNYVGDPTSDNFGTIPKDGSAGPYGSQPRDLQISGKITF